MMMMMMTTTMTVAIMPRSPVVADIADRTAYYALVTNN